MPFQEFFKIYFPGPISPTLPLIPVAWKSSPGRLIEDIDIFGEIASDNHQDFSKAAPPRSAAAICPVLQKHPYGSLLR